MLRPDCDLVARRSHRLQVIPLLLVGDQSSLDEVVVEEDVDNDVVAGVDLPKYILTEADYMLWVQRQARLAAPARGFGFYW